MIRLVKLGLIFKLQVQVILTVMVKATSCGGIQIKDTIGCLSG